MGLATGLKPVSVDNASVRLKTADGEKTPAYKVIVPPGAKDPRIIARCWAEQLGDTAVEVGVKVGKDTAANVTYGDFDAVDVVRNWLRETTGDAKADPLPPKAKAS
jgi:hypothetical protein